jgi:hypothetical protein
MPGLYSLCSAANYGDSYEARSQARIVPGLYRWCSSANHGDSYEVGYWQAWSAKTNLGA